MVTSLTGGGLLESIISAPDYLDLFYTRRTLASVGAFLEFIKSLKEGRRKAKLLESESGAVAGCAVLSSDRRWRDKTFLLDIFAHPNFISYYDMLLNSMELPEGKIQCYVDANAPGEKIAALQQADFNREALLKNQFEWGDDRVDVFIYSKFS